MILSLAIVVSAFYGGFGPALFATAVRTSIGTYFFTGDGNWHDFFQRQNISRTVLFLVIGLSSIQERCWV